MQKLDGHLHSSFEFITMYHYCSIFLRRDERMADSYTSSVKLHVFNISFKYEYFV